MGSLKEGSNARPFGIPANQHLSDGTEPAPSQTRRFHRCERAARPATVSATPTVARSQGAEMSAHPTAVEPTAPPSHR